jgi:hypothetical protein
MDRSGSSHEAPSPDAAATLLMGRYSDDAPTQAAQRADELFNRDDADGYGIWLRISQL